MCNNVLIRTRESLNQGGNKWRRCKFVSIRRVKGQNGNLVVKSDGLDCLNVVSKGSSILSLYASYKIGEPRVLHPWTCLIYSWSWLPVTYHVFGVVVSLLGHGRDIAIKYVKCVWLISMWLLDCKGRALSEIVGVYYLKLFIIFHSSIMWKWKCCNCSFEFDFTFLYLLQII